MDQQVGVFEHRFHLRRSVHQLRLLQGLPPADCLRLASALGASCVRAVGTTPGVFTRPDTE